MFMDRFSLKLREVNNLEFKCFDDLATFTDYTAYMDNKLQQKRRPAPHEDLTTNQKRHKEKECLLWDDNSELRATVREYMISSQEYYQFCDECIGSANDLLAAKRR